MGYLLKKVDDPPEGFPFADNEGCHWPSIGAWLFTGILGGCGCGSSEELEERALKVLATFSLPHGTRTNHIYDDLTDELMAHWMDSKGLLEHGTSIGSSWLSEYGKKVHETVEYLGNNDV